MMGEHGLSWPWESLHVEALAWFDHWLKGSDTGILEGPRIRYVLPGEDHTWQTENEWPLPGTTYQSFALCADGGLNGAEGDTGDPSLFTLGSGVNRPAASETDPASSLVWDSEPFNTNYDMVGDIEL